MKIEEGRLDDWGGTETSLPGLIEGEVAKL
jgi:hypothetical protein